MLTFQIPGLPAGFDSWKQNAPDVDVCGDAEDAYNDYADWAEAQARLDFQAGQHDYEDFESYFGDFDVMSPEDFYDRWYENQEEEAKWRYLDAKHPNL